MCIATPNSVRVPFDCPTSGDGSWSEGNFQDPCSGFGVVTVQQDPDRLFLEAVDEFGVTRVSYTVPDPNAPPTPTPTPTPTVSPTPTPHRRQRQRRSPTIMRQPSDVTVTVGRSARFKVRASGSLPLHYQWKKNGVDIGGATGAQYGTPPTTLEDDQSLFNVVVSNSAGPLPVPTRPDGKPITFIPSGEFRFSSSLGHCPHQSLPFATKKPSTRERASAGYGLNSHY